MVFIAKRPRVGQVVVGWYKSATVFHKRYRKRRGNRQSGDWEKLDYLCEVDSEHAVLLDGKYRTFQVPYAPTHGKGYPGNSNVWYADAGKKKGKEFVARLRKYIDSSTASRQESHKERSNESARSKKPPDKELISRIEQAAIDATWEHYEGQGYKLKSVEKDNRGWDLEAVKNGEILRLEVKGHTGNVVQFELTPNEYAKLKEFATSYRVCIARQVLDSINLEVFSPKCKKAIWYLVSSTGKEVVRLAERVAAKAYEIGSHS